MFSFLEKKITEEMEQECIKANISVYNNLAACILANVKDNSTSNAEKEHEKVVKYTGMVYKKINLNALFQPIKFKTQH